jgi:hypothetical protein
MQISGAAGSDLVYTGMADCVRQVVSSEGVGAATYYLLLTTYYLLLTTYYLLLVSSEGVSAADRSNDRWMDGWIDG